jgi:hypothetical protein
MRPSFVRAAAALSSPLVPLSSAPSLLFSGFIVLEMYVLVRENFLNRPELICSEFKVVLQRSNYIGLQGEPQKKNRKRRERERGRGRRGRERGSQREGDREI